MPQLREQYENSKPIGYHAVTAFWGIAVYDIIEKDYDEYAVTAIIDEGVAGKFTLNKISYKTDGSAYFRKNGMRISLEEVLRNDNL